MGASPEEQPGTRMPDAITSVNGETEPSSSAAVVRVVVRRGEYHDPVTLMEASEAARSVAGVSHVAVGMAEPLNVLIFAQRHGYEVAADGLAPDDLVIALRASDEAAADEALAAIERWLAERGGERRRRAAGDGAAHVPARGSTDRVGGHVRTAAGGDHRGGAARGAGGESGRRGAPGAGRGVRVRAGARTRGARPDGGGDQPVDAGVGGRERDPGQPGLLHV